MGWIQILVFGRVCVFVCVCVFVAIACSDVCVNTQTMRSMIRYLISQRRVCVCVCMYVLCVAFACKIIALILADSSICGEHVTRHVSFLPKWKIFSSPAIQIPMNTGWTVIVNDCRILHLADERKKNNDDRTKEPMLKWIKTVFFSSCVCVCVRCWFGCNIGYQFECHEQFCEERQFFAHSTIRNSI